MTKRSVVSAIFWKLALIVGRLGGRSEQVSGFRLINLADPKASPSGARAREALIGAMKYIDAAGESVPRLVREQIHIIIATKGLQRVYLRPGGYALPFDKHLG